MGMETYKTGLLYTQRIAEVKLPVADIETEILTYLSQSNIDILKKFSDLGYANRMRPGLNELLKYLVNTNEKIDIVAFYSFDHLRRDKRRVNFMMPRIKQYVEEIIFIENDIGLYGRKGLSLPDSVF
ncbi:recombinase family protein [Oceanobacillus rekensis]|uniref:recombinase family protein n=1 Tax=Oceanobacillus rekensis TaxID=937927 RepID=UPI000B43D790|nr:recombinase family protein [Oceanobacillus rekensis]